MRVAALYDIHGNLPALEAVLQDVRRAGVQQIVVGGDVVPGPMPREALACLQALEIPVRFIYGNGDRAVLAQMRGEEPASVPEQFRGVVRWTAEQLDRQYEQMLASWPGTLRLRLGAPAEVLFCHATPRSDTEIFTRRTPDARLVPVFDGLEVDLVVCGHTHMQFDRMIGRVRVVNAGSVGMPFGRPGADWLLLGPDVELRHTSYDLAEAAERIRGTAYPEAASFAARSVLQPPTEDEILAAFAGKELVEPPRDFVKALKARPAAWERWRQLSYSHQREHVESIEGAKTPETRARRIERSVQAIRLLPKRKG